MKKILAELPDKKIAVSVMFDVVKIEIICGDIYLAQVMYDDIIERLQRGDEDVGIIIKTKSKNDQK